jgi:hypothetical protein
MAGVTVTRHDFLQDRQGRTLADVLNDPEQPFDAVLDFFNSEDRQRRMEGSEIHHDRTPLVGIVRELEAQLLIDSFLSSKHPRRTRRFRQAVGVLVSMMMELLRWQKTGNEGSSGVRTTVSHGRQRLSAPEEQYRIRDQRCRRRLSVRSKAMNTFCVWLHPLANGCKVRVLGIENAKWLLNRLTQSSVVKSSETVNEEECYPRCSFQVPYSSQTPRFTLKELLTSIPEIRLMLEPA